VFLYVPRNVVIERPIQAIFLSDEDDAAFSPHILIVAEPNSRVTYVDNVIGGDATRRLVHNGSAEVFAQDGAEVRFASIHCLGREMTDLTYRRARLANDARIQWILGDLNDGDSLSDTMSVLQGRGSGSDTKLICVGTGSQNIHVATRAQHIGRASESDMLTRAVMRDEATGIFNGITKIEKGATDANGQQTERVLMLSPRARGDANPMLLIDEDEVKAGHAASVGQVNREQIYYLMSRGITREDAVKLIVYGFLSPIIEEIPIESVKKQLAALVERKLGHA
jgi:Fe-S cluster assembly protein SufD